MAAGRFGWGSFALRVLFAFALVTLSWNPEGWSYSQWLAGGLGEHLAPKALAGVVLLIGWVIYLRASFRSLGLAGMVLVAALLGTAVWTLSFYGLVSADSPRALGWIVLVTLSLLLGVGMSWSHVRRRLSGQVDMDDVEEG